ncbi:MAG: PglZ domain-containing protein [Bacteroidaceae bacterium]|nr:PglZ domain-containing protein [Bacteroidaceae bacterium]
MATYNLLWADDEIEHLRAHIIFLEKKGYEVTTVTNGTDAIEAVEEHSFDLILLDEMMPGISGLETLRRIKEIAPTTPVVMVTKSEEEDIMDQAIGSQIADYLIKPVNPTQILLSLKKNIHEREIRSEVTAGTYRQEIGNLTAMIDDARSVDDWMGVYRKLVHWELQLQDTEAAMADMLQMQKQEANAAFAKFIRRNYADWMDGRQERPVMSPDVFKHSVFPALRAGEKVALLVFDNFRYDQWRTLMGDLAEMFEIDEQLYLSILPTATQYARNAIFSGLLPLDIERMFPDLWVDEESEEGKNLNERPLIQTMMDRFRRHESFSYHKLNDSDQVTHLLNHTSELANADLNVIVVNFIDMLSHARTELKMVRELANNEAAYRSITLSWFRHSPLRDLLVYLAQTDRRVVITTDHGSIRATTPIKVVGDRNTNTALRYKLGKNLAYNPREVFEVKDPKRIGLPAPNISTTYIFATGQDFIAYPNNYNYYVSYYKNTFQHGGISMEEMLIPLITLKGKNRA